MARHNLPAQLTSFVGREREIAEVRRFLFTTRLLTLTGAGGAGKSRLASEVASRVLGDFSEGVFAVQFASIGDPALVARAVAAALGIPEQHGRPVGETLVDHLRPRKALLLLDNCEHLRAACGELILVLLQGCPHLRILATSRVPLTLPGETLWRVPSLSLPGAGGGRAPGGEECEAVRLFIDRARAAEPSFTLTADNAPAVRDLCRRLDGIPLAIELAAPRVRVLTVEQIAERLDDRFRLLTGGSAAALPRHRTLRAAMDWSYALLGPAEQTLLRRLAGFSGGWTLDAAEAVCGADGVNAPDVLNGLTQLVDNSLVLVEARGEQARYGMLETVRQYGLDRLAESGESAHIRARHLAWYLRLAERADGELRGPKQLAWLETLHAENDNLRAALDAGLHGLGVPGATLRLAGALSWFWYLHGHWTEGRGWLRLALERDRDAPRSALPTALQGAAYLAWRLGDLDEAEQIGRRCLAVSQELGDTPNTVLALIWLGVAAMLRADYDQASARYDEALAKARALGEPWLTALALGNMGVSARDQGDYERAAQLHAESLALCRTLEDRFMIAYSLRNLGIDRLRQSRYGDAAACFEESLPLCRLLRDRWVAAECVDGLGGVAAAAGDIDRAAVLWGAGAALREAIGHRHHPINRADHAQRVSAARARHAEAPFNAAWARGREMSLEQAIDYALRVPGAAEDAGGPGARQPEPEGGLTAREREVVVLVARGLTNREIAAALFITERTAETHVQNIFNKLGISSRAQAAAWAVEHGLPARVTP